MYHLVLRVAVPGAGDPAAARHQAATGPGWRGLGVEDIVTGVQPRARGGQQRRRLRLRFYVHCENIFEITNYGTTWI